MAIFNSYVGLPKGMIQVYHKDVGMLDAQDAQLPHLQGASMFYSPDPAQ